jgi:hypothetical protein
MGIDLEKILNVVGIAESVLTILAILFGGIWAYFNFLKGRKFRPRLEIEISGEPFLKDDVYYIKTILKLGNVGLSNLRIEQKGSALIISSYYSPNDSSKVTDLAGSEVGTFPVFERHEWIEPNETIEEHKVITIPRSAQIALGLHLRIVSRRNTIRRRGIEWNEISIVELLSVENLEETKS